MNKVKVLIEPKIIKRPPQKPDEKKTIIKVSDAKSQKHGE